MKDTEKLICPVCSNEIHKYIDGDLVTIFCDKCGYRKVESDGNIVCENTDPYGFVTTDLGHVIPVDNKQELDNIVFIIKSAGIENIEFKYYDRESKTTKTEKL